MQNTRYRCGIVQRNMDGFHQCLRCIRVSHGDAEIFAGFHIDARHTCGNFREIIMQLALAFFFGCRGQIAAGKAISQQLDVIGQRNVRAAAVGGVHNLHTDRHDGVVLAINVRERSSRAVRIQKCSIKRHLLERIITDAAVIFIAPALNADFGFTNQYR